MVDSKTDKILKMLEEEIDVELLSSTKENLKAMDNGVGVC